MEDRDFNSLVLESEESPESGNVRFLQASTTLMSKLKKGKFPYLIDLIWRCKTPNADGMPSEAELKEIAVLEETLFTALKKDRVAHLVFVLTGEGKRIWSFYAVKPELFGSLLNSSTSHLPLYPLTIEVTHDPDIETYEEVLELFSDL